MNHEDFFTKGREVNRNFLVLLHSPGAIYRNESDISLDGSYTVTLYSNRHLIIVGTKLIDGF
ncbi:hypothetical protein C0389_10235 [bacterium]|nr:hypothetical protein [bacterium]